MSKIKLEYRVDLDGEIYFIPNNIPLPAIRETLIVDLTKGRFVGKVIDVVHQYNIANDTYLITIIAQSL